VAAKKVVPKPKPYPYSLDLEVPPLESIRKLDPWSVLEFFRHEALLRSRTVQDLYTCRDEQTLQRKYGLKWKDFWNRLQWLDPQFPVFQGRWNLKHEVRDDPEMLKLLEQKLFEEEDARYLIVQIDTAVPPVRILQSLKRQLVFRHKRVIAGVQEPRLTITDDHRSIPPYHPRRRPPIDNFMTWAKYLDCYDLRIVESRTFGEIAKKVYPPGGSKARDRAEKAVLRVTGLIRAAEQNNWPPKH
jgi:hypothetical protein